MISKPNIKFEPKEKGGEVTFQQSENPCLVIDVGEGNTCTVNNIRMFLKSSNREKKTKTTTINIEFESKGSDLSMREFFSHRPEDM